MAVGNVKGFKVTKGNETGIAKIATEAYLDGSVTKAKLAQAVQGTLDDVENKADATGDYDTLTAGGAKQLLSTVYVDDNEPYNFRTAGGSADIGDRMYEEVVGGSIVWNQLMPKIANSSGGTDVHYAWRDGVCTLSGAKPDGVAYVEFFSNLVNWVAIANHKYCLAVPNTASVDGRVFSIVAAGGNVPYLEGSNETQYRILNATGDGAVGLYLRVVSTAEFTATVTSPMVFDLTQMFGSTIADYIYSLEQGTAGAGVAWFRNLFPKPYYAYNAGELMSVKAGSHDTVGFNAWDEEWELGKYNWSTGAKENSPTQIRSKNKIPVIGGAIYWFKTDPSLTQSNVAIYFYDADEKYITFATCGNHQITMPDNARYATFHLAEAYGTTYKNDTCFHLAWDGERNGEYEPYEKHEYPLAELELRGIPKLDANNQLYYDGDTYASDGTVTRKYGIVTITDAMVGSVATSTTGVQYASVAISSTGKDNANHACAKYAPYWGSAPSTDGYFRIVASTIYFYDNTFTDLATAKAKLVGLDFVYELATPTTETADTYVNPQVVDDFGTEEYVDYAVEAGDRDVAIPVGHNSQYMNNLRAKLEMAPDSPSGDGKYIVQQSNGENAYIPYTADGRLDAIEAKLPAPPSANGTYKLTATVTGGGVTYTWVAG